MATEKQIEKATVNFYKAAAKYVEVMGGKVVVAGGVQVIKWDSTSTRTYNWTLGIKCTGTPPMVRND